MLDYIFHITLKLIKHHIFGCENVKILSYFTQHFNGQCYITFFIICKPLGFYRYY